MLAAVVANAKLTELRAVLASRSLPNLLCCSVLEDEEGADAMRSLDALLREPDDATYGAAAVAAMFGVIHHARLCGLLKDDLRNCADVDGLITFLRVFGTGRLHLFILALGCHQPVDIREFACGLRLLACEVHGDRFDPEDKHMGRSDFSNMQERIDEIIVATHEQHVGNDKVRRSRPAATAEVLRLAAPPAQQADLTTVSANVSVCRKHTRTGWSSGGTPSARRLWC